MTIRKCVVGDTVQLTSAVEMEVMELSPRRVSMAIRAVDGKDALQRFMESLLPQKPRHGGVFHFCPERGLVFQLDCCLGECVALSERFHMVIEFDADFGLHLIMRDCIGEDARRLEPFAEEHFHASPWAVASV